MKTTQAKYLPIDSLLPFAGHPFQVRDDDEMDRLVWSILTQGLLTPLTVRPLEGGKYEVISGHRRLHACKRAEITEIPALICDLDRDAAAIAVVDSNLHREHLLPSEKAFAYKMKMEAMSHQGKRSDITLGQVVPKSNSNRTTALIGDSMGDGYKTVQRYIRLTYLLPELLQLVDEGRIAMTPAVELSYLTEPEQKILLEAMAENDCTPSLSQAVQLKKCSQAGLLSDQLIGDLMAQPKANQAEKISFRVDDLRKYFPKGYTAAQISTEIFAALKEHQRHRKWRDRDDR